MRTQAAYNRYLKLLKTVLAQKTDRQIMNLYYANPKPDLHQQNLLKFQCRMELIKRGFRPLRIQNADVALLPPEECLP